MLTLDQLIEVLLELQRGGVGDLFAAVLVDEDLHWDPVVGAEILDDCVVLRYASSPWPKER